MCVDREVSKMESGRDLEWGQGNRDQLYIHVKFYNVKIVLFEEKP